MSAPAGSSRAEVYEGFDDEWERGTDDAGSKDADRSSIAPRHLAGWLFADLFLVLFVLVLGLLPTAPDRTHPPVDPTGPASVTSASPPTGPGKEAVIGGIDPTYHPVRVRLSPGATAGAAQRKVLTAADAAKVADAVTKEAALSSKGRRIGMLITFGGAPQFEENARTLARHTNAALLAKAPGLFCGGNVGTRPFWDGDPMDEGHPAYDAVRIDVYYTNSCDENRKASGP